MFVGSLASFSDAHAQDRRQVRHGAATSVSRDRPRPPQGKHGGGANHRPNRPDGSHHGGGGYPDHVGGYDRPGHNRPGGHDRPPHRGDGGNYYGHDRDWDGHDRHDRYWRDDDDGDFWEFLGATAAISAGIALIGAATSDPPSGSCSERKVDDYTYLQCGDRWYIRINEGGAIKYQQVERP